MECERVRSESEPASVCLLVKLINMNTIKIKTEKNIPVERVHDLLVSALEGGSNYWYMIQSRKEPDVITFTDPIWNEEREKDPKFLHTNEVPFNPGGALMIDDSNADDPELKMPVALDLERMITGLELWAGSEYTRHWNDFINEDDDAETADVFLQFCIFGKIIYG